LRRRSLPCGQSESRGPANGVSPLPRNFGLMLLFGNQRAIQHDYVCRAWRPGRARSVPDGAGLAACHAGFLCRVCGPLVASRVGGQSRSATSTHGCTKAAGEPWHLALEWRTTGHPGACGSRAEIGRTGQPTPPSGLTTRTRAGGRMAASNLACNADHL
jgi:hypothetical protein